MATKNDPQWTAKVKALATELGVEVTEEEEGWTLDFPISDENSDETEPVRAYVDDGWFYVEGGGDTYSDEMDLVGILRSLKDKWYAKVFIFTDESGADLVYTQCTLPVAGVNSKDVLTTMLFEAADTAHIIGAGATAEAAGDEENTEEESGS